MLHGYVGGPTSSQIGEVSIVFSFEEQMTDNKQRCFSRTDFKRGKVKQAASRGKQTLSLSQRRGCPVKLMPHREGEKRTNQFCLVSMFGH